jgi:DNA-nicking Smr family endonuclease
MSRKKKTIPDIGGEDLYAAFGVAPAHPPSFREELEENLAGQDMRVVLREKGGLPKTPPSHREKLSAYPPPQAELDLHGFTGAEAERKTSEFIRRTATLHLRTVRIITGKGLHSEGPAVLPDLVEARLRELLADQQIFAFAWDKKAKHRSGALLVYLL